ncbi:hypothetical protein MSG28_009579 [Choristoneura fumiferana]|uniref:Uncharacterized protein n=1 Tax=Choristoneura fumiferana TaxID=7141 RepID=A0ACC0JBW0_CHOFU|nr:hypothetical protein MSG28_009579 [Choristoneura fumiferana]
MPASPIGLLLKKQLLTLDRGEKTFQSCLEVERDLLADYWVSAEGQQLLRAALGAP